MGEKSYVVPNSSIQKQFLYGYVSEMSSLLAFSKVKRQLIRYSLASASAPACCPQDPRASAAAFVPHKSQVYISQAIGQVFPCLSWRSGMLPQDSRASDAAFGS